MRVSPPRGDDDSDYGNIGGPTGSDALETKGWLGSARSPCAGLETRRDDKGGCFLIGGQRQKGIKGDMGGGGRVGEPAPPPPGLRGGEGGPEDHFGRSSGPTHGECG